MDLLLIKIWAAVSLGLVAAACVELGKFFRQDEFED